MKRISGRIIINNIVKNIRREKEEILQKEIPNFKINDGISFGSFFYTPPTTILNEVEPVVLENSEGTQIQYDPNFTTYSNITGD